MITIGLTGGIATGKSVVSDLLKKHGAFIINADLIAHELYFPGTIGFDKIVSCFGDSIVGDDGFIDRTQLAKIVFSDNASMHNLNVIVNPLIYVEIQRLLAELYKQSYFVVVVEAAILIEAGWQKTFDQIWIVSSDTKVVMSRLKNRNGFNSEEALKRISSQMNSDERFKYADVIIENNEGMEALASTIDALWTDKFSSNT
jgi:dephospho-CoA kinase